MLEMNGSFYMYVRETPNNVSALVDLGSGTVAQTYRYSAFGEITASSGSVDQPLRFGAREFDETTGLYYNRARWYDAETGRFLVEDPVRPAEIMNPYAYAANDPVNAHDPHGDRVTYPTGGYSGLQILVIRDLEVLLNGEILGPFGLWAMARHEEWQAGYWVEWRALSSEMVEALDAHPLCSTVNCDAVRVDHGIWGWIVNVIGWIRSGFGNSGLTIGNTIFLNFTPDPSNVRDVALTAHEVFHTWQASLVGQRYYVLEGFRRNIAGPLDPGSYGRAFSDYNMEQQGRIIQRCYLGVWEACRTWY